MSWFRDVRSKIYDGFRWFLSPVVKFLVFLKIPPSVITVIGVLITAVAVILMWLATLHGDGRVWMRVAGGVILFAAAWDTLDGEVARSLGRTSPKGAFLDSVFDRVSEFIVYLGLFLFAGLGALDKTLLFALLFTSLAISYIRARAEGVGIECKVGLFDRATRIIILGVALITVPMYLNWIIRALLAGTFLTATRRFSHVLRSKPKS